MSQGEILGSIIYVFCLFIYFYFISLPCLFVRVSLQSCFHFFAYSRTIQTIINQNLPFYIIKIFSIVTFMFYIHCIVDVF